MRIARAVTAIILGLSVGGLAIAAAQDQQSQMLLQPSKKIERANAKKAQAKKIININTADVKALTSLKGINKKKAEAIIKYRQENGKFNSIDELTKIKGINKKIITRNRNRITVG